MAGSVGVAGGRWPVASTFVLLVSCANVDAPKETTPAVTPVAQTAPPPARQNPSPMAESARKHERLTQRVLLGERFSLEGLLSKPVTVFVPARPDAVAPRLLIHFHGAAWVPEQAAAEASRYYVVAAVHLGAGSGIYERSFRDDPALFARLLSEIEKRVSFRGVDLSGFSAGYGAIRAILADKSNLDRVDGVLLLDGLHSSYVPEEKVLHEGGALDEEKLAPFIRFARLAADGSKTFLITHSEIFPGTFASTTETSDHLLGSLDLSRTPVLEWGPLGMQRLSEAHRGSFTVLGFAGNTAPDHIDHFHAMKWFLDLLR